MLKRLKLSMILSLLCILTLFPVINCKAGRKEDKEQDLTNGNYYTDQNSSTGHSAVQQKSDDDKNSEEEKVKTKAEKTNEAVTNFQKSVIGKITNFLFAFAILTSLLSLIIVIYRIGASGTKPSERHSAITDFLICLGCTAVLGSVKFVTQMIIGIVVK